MILRSLGDENCEIMTGDRRIWDSSVPCVLLFRFWFIWIKEIDLYIIATYNISTINGTNIGTGRGVL